MTSPLPVDDVVACDVHEAYRVQFDALEDINWAASGSPDAASALKAIIGEGEAEVLQLLKWEVTSEFSDQVNYAGAFGDGTVHGAVTVSRQPQGDVWAVTHVVVCTLEEVPPEVAEDDEDAEFGYLEDDDLFGE
jgi:hypothetical protein